MSFLPKPGKPGKIKPGEQVGAGTEDGAFIAGNAKSPQAKDLIELLTLGHQILKGMTTRDTTLERTATQALMDKIEGMDPKNNKDDLSVLMSVVMTLAVSVPPTVYGDDYNEWGMTDD